MTKSTKILAGLGVVAALGVSALPLCSYADEASVSGNVLLAVEVEPAIAMTITGNNDDNSHYAAGATATGVDVYSDIEGNTYGKVDGHATDSSTGSATTSTAGEAPNTYTIYNTAGTAISSSYAKLVPNSVYIGNSTNNFASNITVYTNDASGYTLSVKDADSTLTLANSGESIAAGTTIKAGTSAWGYAVDTVPTVGTGDHAGEYTYTAITAADVTVKTKTNGKTSGGEGTVVYYGVSTAADQAAGVYTDTITYTAVTNN